MTQITEDYVSFETAKLLKEKGFNEICHSVYDDKVLCSVASLNRHYECGYGDLVITCQNTDYDDWENKIAAPTLQMAMKWLREVHKLGVFPTTYYREINRNVKHDYGSTIVRLDTYEVIGNGENIEDYTFEAETYEETADKAIKYCLENLI